MTPVVAINSGSEHFEITWDLGRRCNFDCTYCADHRHNNTSPHASLETLIKTSKFVIKYKNLLQTYMYSDREYLIGFTGGEPTNNPNFLAMCEYMHSLNDPSIKIDVTTNGAFSETYCNKLMETVDKATISYHCEVDQSIKDTVIDRIYQMKESNYECQVNLMFHAQDDYFNECVNLLEQFQKDDIQFVPRIIGESYDNDRYNHRYTEQQHSWFRNYWNPKEKWSPASPRKKGRKELGRPCCGRREFYTLDETTANKMLETEIELKTNDWHKSVFACSTEFKEWSCMINWNWLHIEQEYDRILHHQTCRANFGGKRGEIGTITDCDKIIERLENQFATGIMPVIVCPNKLCGCGLCVQKSKHHKITTAMFNTTVKGLTPSIGTELKRLNTESKDI